MNEHNEHWDPELPEEDSYQTGSTKPPKNRGGIVAVVLIATIFLCGLVSAFALLNIQLFTKSSPTGTIDDLLGIFPVASQPAPTEQGAAPAVTVPEDGSHSLTLNKLPQKVENIPQSGGLSLQQIYAKAIDSVVSISTDEASGTGVILSSNGYLVTNYHVVADNSGVQVLLTDGREFPAVLVGVDPVSDLAVLYIDAKNLKAAEFGDSSTLRVGDAVVAIGDPLGIELRGTMTDGIVSAINRDISTGDGWKMSLIQTNAALNSGNSGGPLLNCFGQVIGINALKIGAFSDKAGVEGLGFAIPSVTVKEVVDQLIGQGYVSGRPYLGIHSHTVSSDYQKFYHLPAGVRVANVDSQGPSSKLLMVGDIITALDEYAVQSSDDLIAALYSHTPGDTVRLSIYRKGRNLTVDITLGQTQPS